jgi:putative component of toxin-antitoxin plasmid stabilization module
MINLKRTQLFSDRLRGLRDQEARIGTRLDRSLMATRGNRETSAKASPN